MKFKYIISLITIIILLNSYVGYYEAEELVTSTQLDSIRSDYIQNLINKAKSGDTIIIPAGVYYENIIINKSITLVGEDKLTTIIDGGNYTNDSLVAVLIIADYVKISNFIIRNCVIGVKLDNCNNVTISENIIINNGNISRYKTNTGINYNALPNTLSGINLISSNYIQIFKNVIENNNYGVNFYNSSNNSFYNNNIKENKYKGIEISNSDNNNIHHNNFIENSLNAYDTGNNSWDYKKVGNYWSDYTQLYPNASKIYGIWNIAYNITGGKNKDNYPSVEIINQNPVSDFTFNPINPTTQNLIEFNDKSNDTDGYIVMWSWIFGDGKSSNIRNPTHRYPNNGNYTISLTVTDNNGATNKKSKTINVLNVVPSANFNYTPILPNDIGNISFNDLSNDIDGIIVSWFWDFGDGNVSSNKNASHKYFDDGVYNVTLIVKDDDNASNLTRQKITVLNVKPNAGFSHQPINPNINDTVNFIDNSNDYDGKIVFRSWDFGDGTTSTNSSPSHQFNEGKNYMVTLTVIDDDGAANSTTKVVGIMNPIIPSEEGKGFIIILIIFLVIFISLIGVVIWFSKKNNS